MGLPPVDVGTIVRVQVPATSANLGPAFDAAGLALGLTDELEVEALASGIRIEVDGQGAGAVPLDETHLVVQAMYATFRRLEVDEPGLWLRCTNHIPHSRGLGSSAAAIVSGVLAARELVEGGVEALPVAEVLALAAQLEGHPDNVAAAVLGGLTVAWTGHDAPLVLSGTETGPAGTAFVSSSQQLGAIRLEPSPDIVPVVLVPSAVASTRSARGVLPSRVPHADAALTGARCALLIAALVIAPGILLPATYDVLHQPYRAALMPDTARLVEQLRGVGLAAVVSGAGPSVLVLASDPAQVRAAVDRCPAHWQALTLGIGAGARAQVVRRGS